MNIYQEQTLIFLHIPKAAGTTLHRIIERQYGSTAVFSNPDVVSAVGRYSDARNGASRFFCENGAWNLLKVQKVYLKQCYRS